MNFTKGTIKISSKINNKEKIGKLSESEINSVIPLLKDKKIIKDLINYFSSEKSVRKLPYGSFLP